MGPRETFTASALAAAQLHQTCRSYMLQYVVRAMTAVRDEAGISYAATPPRGKKVVMWD